MITLYHVSYGMDVIPKEFVPRIPESVCKDCDENDDIPRICFADSIEKCFQAKEGLINIGAMFTVYTLCVDESDPNLVQPATLFRNGYVPDALESHEFWYLKSVQLQGDRKILTNIEKSFAIAWTAISVSDIVTILKSLQIPCHFAISDLSAEQICEMVQKDLDKQHKFELQDALYDAIAELPWAQVLRVDKIEYSTWDEKPYAVAFVSKLNTEIIKSFDNQEEAKDFYNRIVSTDKLRAIFYDYYDNTAKNPEPKRIML